MNIGLPLYKMKNTIIDLRKVSYVKKPDLSVNSDFEVYNINISIDGIFHELCEMPEGRPPYFRNDTSLEEKEDYYHKCVRSCDEAYEQFITAWSMVVNNTMEKPQPKLTEERRLDPQL